MKNYKKIIHRQERKTSRRDFLGGVAAAIAFPYIVPSSVLGVAGTTPPSNRIVTGHIGVGMQGIYDMKAFLTNSDVQVVAVCDVNTEGSNYHEGGTAGRKPAQQVAEGYYAKRKQAGVYSGCAIYSDFRELLARDDIDAVLIATPDHWHGLIAVAAAQAGKDIYCEKPLANTIAEGRAICEAVQHHGRILQTGSHERSRDTVRFACELVRNGRIGKLHTIRVNIPFTDEHHIEVLQSRSPQYVAWAYSMGTLHTETLSFLVAVHTELRRWGNDRPWCTHYRPGATGQQYRRHRPG